MDMVLEIYDTPNHGAHIRAHRSAGKANKWLFAHCVGDTFASINNKPRIEYMLIMHGVTTWKEIYNTKTSAA